MYDHILVTGSIRSGTTYVGDVLSHAIKNSYLINEPFSYNHGIVGIKHWDPYTEGDVEYYNELFNSFFAMNSTFKHHKRNKWDKYLKSIIKSRAHYNYLMYNIIGRHKKESLMILKDPLAALSSKYLFQRFNVGTIVLFRHPGAFFYSNKRLGWDFNLQQLFSQRDLVNRYLKDEEKMYSSNLSYVERISLLWRCINKVLLEFTNEAKERKQKYWVAFTHEQLCEAPKNIFQEIAKEFHLQFESSVYEYVLESTSAENKAKVDNTHVLKRNSKELIDYWKYELSKKEIQTIRRLTEDISEKIYSPESWTLKP